MANPFAAEYGRFSTSITQIRTRGGTNDWDFSIGNLVPRFRGLLRGIRGFEPRASIRGPIRKDRLFLAQDFQFRYVATPVKSLPDEPDVAMRSFDSFTRARQRDVREACAERRADHVSPRDRPRDDEHVPAGGDDAGMASGRDGRRVASTGWRSCPISCSSPRSHFGVSRSRSTATTMPRWSTRRRHRAAASSTIRNATSRSYQWVEALSLTRDLFSGQHVFKFGTDLQRSEYTGLSASRPVEIRRLDGSLAERTAFGAASTQYVHGTEFAVFAQDRWRVNSRLTFELGVRVDRDGVGEGTNWSPRAGMAIARAARRPRDRARRVRQIRPAHAAQRRGIRVVRATHHLALQRRWLANRPADHVDQPDRWPASHARSRGRQHRMGPAVWPPRAVEGGVSGAQRLARARCVA